ncbi:MAG: hypothetical protein U0744_06625, partial [Gemmataceae bacterium]
MGRIFDSKNSRPTRSGACPFDVGAAKANKKIAINRRNTGMGVFVEVGRDAANGWYHPILRPASEDRPPAHSFMR